MQFLPHLLVFVIHFVLCLTDAGIHNSTFAALQFGKMEKASGILEISRDYISKAKDLYPDCDEDEDDLISQKKEKSLACLDFANEMISNVEENYLSCPDPKCPECREYSKYDEKPIDCSEIFRSGKKKSGVYTIWPNSRIFPNNSLEVYCDMDTHGGGWTVIQRRGWFSTPKDYFYKDWESYKKGFGNLLEEFWLGNDNIYAITNQAFLNKPYKIRFDVIDAAGNKGYSEFSSFWIDDEAASYTIHVTGYTGINGDALYGQNGMKFTTKDRDNDRWNGNCAHENEGAWWYNACHAYANLNGIYQPGVNAYKSMTWHSWKGFVGLSGAEIKIRV